MVDRGGHFVILNFRLLFFTIRKHKNAKAIKREIMSFRVLSFAFSLCK